METADTALLGLRDLAIVRAAGYALLAGAFAYPDAARCAALREVAAVTGDVLAQTPLAALAARAAEGLQAQREAEHVQTFSVSSSVDCPTFETAYLSTDPSQQTQRMADVAGFYRAFGVDPASPGFRPDDVSVELLFMGFLCTKEANAREQHSAARVDQVRRAQRLFLRDHLARWGGSLGRRLALRAPAGSFLQCAGVELDAWLDADCRLLRTGAIEEADAPAMKWDAPGGEATPFDEDELDLISPDEIPVL